MKRNTTLLTTFAICVLLTLTLAQATWHPVSNVYEGQTEVTPAPPVELSPHGSGHPPVPTDSAVTGVPFNLLIDVTNPSPVSVYGIFVLNISKPNMAYGDVYVSSTPCWCTKVTNLGFSNGTAFYQIEQSGCATPYFELRAGFNANVTVLTIQYNNVGSYSWKLVVVR